MRAASFWLAREMMRVSDPPGWIYIRFQPDEQQGIFWGAMTDAAHRLCAVEAPELLKMYEWYVRKYF